MEQDEEFHHEITQKKIIYTKGSNEVDIWIIYSIILDILDRR